MQLSATFGGFLKSHLKITKVVDGDGIFVQDIFSKEEEEIRFLGIDAPEIKSCKKLVQDERETHLPAQLLIELGHQSWEHLRNLATIGESVSILTESNDPLDPYGRTLAYVFLPDRTCLNEKMIEDGFAKPYDRFFCSKLTDYQILSSQARLTGTGLFSRITNF
jgi:micrococcal nuclease